MFRTKIFMIKNPLKYCLLFFFVILFSNAELLHIERNNSNEEIFVSIVNQYEITDNLIENEIDFLKRESAKQSNHNYLFNNLAQRIDKGRIIDLSQKLFWGRVRLELQI